MSELEDAEKALEEKHSTALRDINRREEELARERRALQREQTREQRKLRKDLDHARRDYERALKVWEDWSADLSVGGFL